MADTVGVRVVGVAAVAFVLGLMAGGFGPREEVRDLRRQLFEMEQRGSGFAGKEITRLLTGGLRKEAGRAREEGDEPAPTPSEGSLKDQLMTADDPAIGDLPAEPLPTGQPPVGANEVELAREAMAARAAQARAALIEDLHPDEEQLQAIDAVIDGMNDRLVEMGYEVVERLEQGGDPDRRAMMRFAADALSVMADTEDALFATMSADQASGVRPEATDPTAFIDGAVVDVLSGLQGRVDGGEP